MGGGMLGARRLAAWFGVFALAMCIRTASANSEGRGLKLELAKELCAQSIFLRGVAQAASDASDEARKQAGAAREKQAMVLRVWQATGNASLARLAEEANTVAALADAVTGAAPRIIERATRHAWRISDFITTFGSMSGAVTGTGKLCIGKTEGTSGGAENAANDGNTDYVLASHLAACGADESAVKKVVALVKPTKNTFTVTGVGPEKILNGRRYADMLTYRAIVDRSDLLTGQTPHDDNKACTLTHHRARATNTIGGIIGTRTAEARKVTWAGLLDMTPASTTKAGKQSPGTAATTFAENINGKADCNKLADELKKLQAAQEKLTEACTKSAQKICNATEDGEEEALREAHTTKGTGTKDRNNAGHTAAAQTVTRARTKEHCTSTGGTYDHTQQTCTHTHQQPAAEHTDTHTDRSDGTSTGERKQEGTQNTQRRAYLLAAAHLALRDPRT
ncbi:hypothetical protein, conserved in T. vivax [Trypanosoma vivax Y486]|uniref:Variant surface glycoprotein (VSG) n=1 Tax=Trypanosoma vivax (strain Y486) TaxID=1055687 RepID=F9WLL7_TRYVY|nr:hypothetical protein, conserved in T. vivax [Trypanosoma vivax Y486]|eukprot:CCD18409.1 hypothetical protein, conserved in T. vivax [Trypanosoma vivax Y486]